MPALDEHHQTYKVIPYCTPQKKTSTRSYHHFGCQEGQTQWWGIMRQTRHFWLEVLEGTWPKSSVPARFLVLAKG